MILMTHQHKRWLICINLCNSILANFTIKIYRCELKFRGIVYFSIYKNFPLGVESYHIVFILYYTLYRVSKNFFHCQAFSEILFT